MDLIQPNDEVLIQLPSDTIKLVKLVPGSYVTSYSRYLPKNPRNTYLLLGLQETAIADRVRVTA
jgi:hypothetical protein